MPLVKFTLTGPFALTKWIILGYIYNVSQIFIVFLNSNEAVYDLCNWLQPIPIEKQNLLKTKEQALWEIDEHELRSRYDLLRNQTKSFYSLFRTMLTQQSEKELQRAFIARSSNLWWEDAVG